MLFTVANACQPLSIPVMKDPVNSVVGELLDPRNRIAVAEELSRHLLGMSDGTNEGAMCRCSHPIRPDIASNHITVQPFVTRLQQRHWKQSTAKRRRFSHECSVNMAGLRPAFYLTRAARF